MFLSKGINVLSLFDGMSCGRIALGRSGVTVNTYYAAEIDKFATQVSNANCLDARLLSCFILPLILITGE